MATYVKDKLQGWGVILGLGTKDARTISRELLSKKELEQIPMEDRLKALQENEHTVNYFGYVIKETDLV